MTNSRTNHIHYLDHIKLLLTILVVLHHTFITYGAPGGWYYREPATGLAALVPMTFFVSVNQSFFMGLFFFLAACFIEPSIERKGVARFFTDRLKRLGLPLVFYAVVLSPVLNYEVEHFTGKNNTSFWQYLSGYHHWIDFGVLWFVAALLLFTMLYLALRPVVYPLLTRSYVPGWRGLLLFSVLLGLITFFVRLLFPVGWVLYPVGFQLGHFPQYILLFCAGLVAGKSNWLQQAEWKTGRVAWWVVISVIVVGYPALMALYLAQHGDATFFSGGWHKEAFIYSIWEQVVGVHIIVALLLFSKTRWNTPRKLLSKLARCAFAVYIFHPLVLISVSLLLAPLPVAPVIKLLICAPLAVTGSFLLAMLILKVRFVAKVI